jgi:hypothetical protein
MFWGVIDKQFQELNNRFDEVNTELLRCMASFNPTNSFSAFDVEKLVKLARFYSHDFDFEEMNQLPFHLNRYISCRRLETPASDQVITHTVARRATD